MSIGLFQFVRKWRWAFLAGFVFAILCFLGINAAMETVSSNAYCGTDCHEMNVSYRTWEMSVHGTNEVGMTVGCVDCHLPPKEDYFTHLVAKAYAGGKDLYKHHFGPEYDREAIRQKVIDHMHNERCLYCHDNLLAKPSSGKSRFAHLGAMNEPEKSENNCLACHVNAGHEREKTVFSEASI